MQQVVLYKARWRRSPTVRELAEALRIDESTANIYISRIIRKGYASRWHRRRQIFIAVKGTYIVTQKHITYKTGKNTNTS